MELSFERMGILLSIAVVVTMMARKFRMPHAVRLTVAGVALAMSPLRLKIDFTKVPICTVILPSLMFEAANPAVPGCAAVSINGKSSREWV